MDFSHIGRWPPDSSTIIGLGILAGVAVFWWTGVREVGLVAAAAVTGIIKTARLVGTGVRAVSGSSGRWRRDEQPDEVGPTAGLA
jgi:hypothetical protein